MTKLIPDDKSPTAKVGIFLIAALALIAMTVIKPSRNLLGFVTTGVSIGGGAITYWTLPDPAGTFLDGQLPPAATAALVIYILVAFGWLLYYLEGPASKLLCIVGAVLMTIGAVVSGVGLSLGSPTHAVPLAFFSLFSVLLVVHGVWIAHRTLAK